MALRSDFRIRYSAFRIHYQCWRSEESPATRTFRLVSTVCLAFSVGVCFAEPGPLL
jgi:hypothetical protein